MEKNNKTVIEKLQDEMDNHGFVSRKAIKQISEELDVAESDVFGVATFYSQFSLTPPAKHVISVCIGTACFVLGGGEVLSFLEDKLGIKAGQTTADGMFKLVGARCVGCCGFAPAISIDGEIFGKITKEKALSIVDDIIAKEQK